MPVGEVNIQSALLAEQAEYYRARAAEYDEWFLRKGRYDRGLEHTLQWSKEVEELRGKLNTQAPFGEVLEFAGGTGLWTEYLAKSSASLTVVDASEEMLSLNAARNLDPSIRWVHANIFDFQPDRMYDFIFFGFWLSHVPSDRFEDFWSLVTKSLKPSGQVFFIDSIKEPQSTAADHVLPDEDDSETLVRRLNDGREFRIYKVFYQPDTLQERLADLGWIAQVSRTDTFFLYGFGSMKESTLAID